MSPHSFKTLVVLAIVVLLMKQTICQSNLFPYKMKRLGATKYCGSHLANTLMLVCNGLYNSMFKKSLGAAQPADHANSEDDYQYYDSPFRPRQSANDLMSRLAFSRMRRQDQTNGIYNECCVKSCTINELLSYCATRP